jgi:hypothetical protein
MPAGNQNTNHEQKVYTSHIFSTVRETYIDFLDQRQLVGLDFGHQELHTRLAVLAQQTAGVLKHRRVALPSQGAEDDAEALGLPRLDDVSPVVSHNGIMPVRSCGCPGLNITTAKVFVSEHMQIAQPESKGATERVLPAVGLQQCGIVPLRTQHLAVGVIPIRRHGGVLDHRSLEMKPPVGHEDQRVALREDRRGAAECLPWWFKSVHKHNSG